jgi:hypothetical protein
MTKPKSAALNANVPTVKSARVPAKKQRREYRDFDNYARTAAELDRYATDAIESNVPHRWVVGNIRAAYKAFDEAIYFSNAMSFTTKGMAKRNMLI